MCVYVDSAVDSSLHSEAAGLLHSCQQFLIKFLIRLIGRDVYPVKTGDEKAALATPPFRDHSKTKRPLCVCPYHVCALGRLSVLASIRWMVKSLGPAEPVEPYKHTF